MPRSFGVGIPLESTDYFRFRAISTSDIVTVSYFGRIQRPDGTIVPWRHQLDTASPNTVYEVVPVTGAGILLGAAASVPIGSITAGSVSAIGEIGRVNGNDFVPHTLLFSGQVDDQQPLSSTLASPATPVGMPTYRFLQNAGSSTGSLTLNITPTQGKRARVVLVTCDYVTDATAGNRLGSIRYAISGNSVWRGLADTYIGASTNGVFRGALEGQFSAETTNLPGAFRQLPMPLPASLHFTAPFSVIATSFQPGGAADLFSLLSVTLEET